MKILETTSARALIAILTTLILVSILSAQDFEDYNPEVSARVARVKMTRGEAVILRKDADEWEKVVLNLPIVEGDEIVLERGARLEIQLDSWNFIRIDENSRIRLTTLNEDGVAVSLINGTLSARVGNLEGDGKFFEIDAPGSTIAVQRKGLFKINATDSVNGRVSVSVGDDGEARVYSETSGFTLRGDRTATLFLVGSRKGEWDLAEVRGAGDEFDRWVRSRDDLIAQKLKGADFNKYYDSDFYGADDLNDYGTWVDTSEYGNVWRPHRTTTNVYVNWSPYRYGHWRWVPPYGWTWVNDEPWGWVTYHHGRWVYISGYWHWAPYPHPSYRWTRSWWRPAFVSFYYYGGSVCWYPLPYYSSYYDYNRIYYSRWSNRNYARNSRWRPQTVVVNIINVPRDYDRRNPRIRGNREQIPERGIVVVDKNSFGRSSTPGRLGNREVSRKINSSPVIESSPVLPDFNPRAKNRDSKIFVSNKPTPVRSGIPRPGVGERTDDKPADPRLRQNRIFGDRTPTQQPDSSMPIEESRPGNGQRPGTGVVTRPERGGRPETQTPERNPESVNPRTNTPRNEPGGRPGTPPRTERSPEPERSPTPGDTSPRVTPPRNDRRGSEGEVRPSPTPTPRVETPRRETRPTPTPDQGPRYGTPRPTPTPDQGPRYGTPRPTPTPDQGPRYGTPRPTPTPDQGPRYGTPRPTPTPDQGPRYGTPRPTPTPDQGPRYGTPRPTPVPPTRNETPRSNTPPRQNPPRVTVPTRPSTPPKTESSPPKKDPPNSPERSQERPTKNRDN